jgi:hypothetical protein
MAKFDLLQQNTVQPDPQIICKTWVYAFLFDDAVLYLTDGYNA